MRFRLNPWIGVGFESFWLGDRAQYFWDMYWWHPNEAHNGYLEMYLDLGWIGVAMILVMIATGYRNAVAGYRDHAGFGRLRLALLVVAPVYSITEAAFKLVNPVWVSFMLATTALAAAQTSGDALVAAPGPVPADGVPTRAPQGLTPVLTPWKMPPPAPARRPVFKQVGR